MIATIKNLLKLSGLEGNVRIFSRWTILRNIGSYWNSCRNSIYRQKRNWNTKQSLRAGRRPFFIESYKTEVKRVFNSMFYYRKGESESRHVEFDTYDNFALYVKAYPDTFRHLLQHIYTSSKEGEGFYQKIKEAVCLFEVQSGTNQIKRQRLFEEFMKEYYRLKNFHTSVSYPDFGACEYCIKKIKLEEIQKHTETFQEKDPSFWDLFSQNSESK